VNAFYLEGMSMLRLGKAAGVSDGDLEIIAGALSDAVSNRVGQMERTLDDAHCALDPAHVDTSELDAFLESVK